MHRWLLLLLLIVQLLSGIPRVQAQGDPVSIVILLVNGVRAANGLPVYEVDAALMSAAQAQASWSAANNHIGHDGPGGSYPNDRALAAGYGGGAAAYAVENAAHGTASMNTPDWVVTMWQSDSVHLSAIISPKYEHIGVGYAEAGGNSWYVMMAGWVDDDGYQPGAPPQLPPGGAAPSVPFILSQPDESGAIYHVVQPGQTAWTIAAQYGIDLAELLALNNLTEDSILHPGDVLLIRPPVPTLTPLPVATTGASSPAPATAISPTGSAGEVASETPTAAVPALGTIPATTDSVAPDSAADKARDVPSQSWMLPASLFVAAGIFVLIASAFVSTRRVRD